VYQAEKPAFALLTSSVNNGEKHLVDFITTNRVALYWTQYFKRFLYMKAYLATGSWQSTPWPFLVSLALHAQSSIHVFKRLISSRAETSSGSYCLVPLSLPWLAFHCQLASVCFGSLNCLAMALILPPLFCITLTASA